MLPKKSDMSQHPTPCPLCRQPTVEIALFEGASRLTMRSCSKCDHRMWLRAGQPASRRDVLASVGTNSKRRAS